MQYSKFVIFLLLLVFCSAEQSQSKYAFVTIYYSGNKASTSDFIAIRTMYRSFLKMKSIADFIVLVDPYTSNREINQLKKDGMIVQTADITNIYKQKKFPIEYQKTENILYLWGLKQYKRVIYVDCYTIFIENFDSLFNCSYLCLKDEQPLMYINDLIVITPGHEPTRKIYNDCIHTKATFDQFSLYNHYGVYSTELYELSQAAPVFDIGSNETDGVNIRRYLNYVNFPCTMWYEKFNFDLYSCSNTKNREIPVYSMSYHYTLGHKPFFLPTHWFGYKYFFVFNNHFLPYREELHETFYFTYFWLIALLAVLILTYKYTTCIIAVITEYLHNALKSIFKQIKIGTAVTKLIVALLIECCWATSIWIVPYQLFPSQGYFFFYTFYAVFLGLFMIGFNKAASNICNIKINNTTQMTILILTHAIYAILYVFPLIDKTLIPVRFVLMFVQFFIEEYCVYSQLSPLLREKDIIYSSLPE